MLSEKIAEVTFMAKGQKRGNRELKKPKGSKKPVLAATSFLHPSGTAAPAKPLKK
jgi:hypothetical protein